jgi:hypothetical protein
MSTTIGSDDAMLAEGDTLAGSTNTQRGSVAAQAAETFGRLLSEGGWFGGGRRIRRDGTSYTRAGETVKTARSSLT